jgi:hypothetical protein
MNTTQRSSCLVAAMLAVTLLTGARQSRAAVIFDTFGPGDSYGTSAYMIGAMFGSPFRQCAAFTLTGTQAYRLDSIEVALAQIWTPTGSNEVAVQLLTSPGGTLIEEFAFSGQMEDYGAGLAPLVGTSSLHPVLDPGVEYWLMAYAPVYGTIAQWSQSDPAIYGPTQTLGTGIPQPLRTDLPLPAFTINGTPVPAPGAVILAALGAAMVGWVRHRSQRLVSFPPPGKE